MMSAETARNSDLGSHSVQMIYYTDVIDYRKSNFFLRQEWRLVLPLTPVNNRDRISLYKLKIAKYQVGINS